MNPAFCGRRNAHGNRIDNRSGGIQKRGEQAHRSSAVIEPVAVQYYRFAVDKTKVAARTLVLSTRIEQHSPGTSPRRCARSSMNFLQDGAHLPLAQWSYLGGDIEHKVVGRQSQS